MRGSQRTWLLGVSTFIPIGVGLFDMAQDPAQQATAILSLITAGVLALAASMTIVFPHDSDGTVVALVAMAAFWMTIRAVVMQSVSATAVTVVVSGVIFLLFMKARPRVKVKEQ